MNLGFGAVPFSSAPRPRYLSHRFSLPQQRRSELEIASVLGRRPLHRFGYTTLSFEYESVLSRKEQREISGLSDQQLEDAIQGLAALIEPVRVNYQWRPQLTDADDELVLEAAINGSAQIIVTHNVRDFLPAAEKFGLQIITPGVIIKTKFS